MKKQLGSITLLAGTAIGSGMISLPIVLANFGIIGSFLLMIFFAWVTYISAMIRCELNIHSKSNFSLKDVGLFFSGKIAASIGDISIKVLSFALLCAYIFGGASIIKSIIGCENFTCVALVFSVFIFCIFIISSKLIIKVNKYIFILMMFIIIAGIAALTLNTHIKFLPMHSHGIFQMKQWSIVLPVIFTSFGFHGSLHSMTNFVENDKKLIKRACLFGSIIPVFVYSLWVICTLTIISNSDSASFSKMLASPIDVCELVSILSNVTGIRMVQHVAWLVSFFAIFTSIMGVGLSLNDILKKDLEKMELFKKGNNRNKLNILAILSSLIPTTIIAIIVPNAFIKVLNFSGIILAIIAIILPVFLFIKMKKIHGNTRINILKISTIFLIGVVIICLGILDIFV
jgi:tyrosine-specific transport protein